MSTDATATTMRAALQQQRSAFTAEGEVTLATRTDRIDRAIDLLYDNRHALTDAIASDFGSRSRHQTLLADIHMPMESMKHARQHLKQWMKADKRRAPFPLNLIGSKATLEHEPKGVVGNISTWNFPIVTSFGPLTSIFAAGNRAMIKFSEMTPATGALLESLIDQYYDPEECIGFNGGPEAGAAFSALPFDHIVFTGSTSIGRHVLRAAAENLVPVTLELGGKSPVIVGRDYRIIDAVERILQGKLLNCGQVCISPDYIFVPEESLEDFITHCEKYLSQLFPSMRDNPDYSSIVNQRHQQRLLGYLQEAREAGADVREINPANEDFSQQSNATKVPFTLVINPDDSLLVTKEEIFGPIINIKGYQSVEDCIDYINAKPRPLALYHFSHDKEEQRKVLGHTLSGGVTINDVMMHASSEDLPIGGIGASGMGNYHGIDGFKTFSHPRAVFRSGNINLQKLAGMLPPYGEKAEKNIQRMLKK